MFFCGVGSLKRPINVADNCALNLLCLGLDNRHPLIKLGQDFVTQLICLGDVGLRIGSGSLKVGKRRLDKLGVAGVCQFD